MEWGVSIGILHRKYLGTSNLGKGRDYAFVDSTVFAKNLQRSVAHIVADPNVFWICLGYYLEIFVRSALEASIVYCKIKNATTTATTKEKSRQTSQQANKKSEVNTMVGYNIIYRTHHWDWCVRAYVFACMQLIRFGSIQPRTAQFELIKLTRSVAHLVGCHVLSSAIRSRIPVRSVIIAVIVVE